MSGEKLTLPGGELTLDQNMTPQEKEILENAVKSMKLDDFKKIISEQNLKTDIQVSEFVEGIPIPMTKKIDFMDIIDGKEDIDTIKSLKTDYIGLLQFYLTLKGWYRAEINGKWNDTIGFLLKNQKEKIPSSTQPNKLPSNNKYFGNIKLKEEGNSGKGNYETTGFDGTGVVETEKYTMIGSFQSSELVEGSKLHKNGTIENGTFKEGNLYTGTKAMPNGEIWDYKNGESKKRETQPATNAPAAPQAPAVQGGTTGTPADIRRIDEEMARKQNQTPAAPAKPKPERPSKPTQSTTEGTHKPESKEHLDGKELTKKTIESNKMTTDTATQRIQPVEPDNTELLKKVLANQKPEDIKKLQKIIGTKVDGVFGKKSLDALVKYSEKFPEIKKEEKKEEPKVTKAPEGIRESQFDIVKKKFSKETTTFYNPLARLVREVTDYKGNIYNKGLLPEQNHIANKAILEGSGWSGKERTNMSKEEKTTLLKNVRKFLELE